MGIVKHWKSHLEPKAAGSTTHALRLPTKLENRETQVVIIY